MFQNVQAVADISRLADDDSNDFFPQNETLKIVTCPICQAVYLPAFSRQEAAQSSFAVLEAAFLRVCHFCFRCQRPACPQCWNPVHHVCTACGEEAHLPFLSPVPSLVGLVFAPTISPRQAQAADLPLTCMRNGRFFLPKSVRSQHTRTGGPRETALRSEPLEAAGLPSIQARSISALARPPYPPWLQEMLSRQAEDQIATPTQATISQEQRVLGNSQGKEEMQPLESHWEGSVAPGLEYGLTASIVQGLERNQVNEDARTLEHRQNHTITQPAESYLAQFVRGNSARVEAQLAENKLAFVDDRQGLESTQENIAAQSAGNCLESSALQNAGGSQVSGTLCATHTDTLDPMWLNWEEEEIATLSQSTDSRRESAGTLAEAIARAQRRSRGIHLVAWIENVLIVIMAALLLALILMIALAVRSTHMNALFLQLIHVDIRAEIAYLLQAI